MANENEAPTAPYITWGTFEGFVAGLKGTAIPARIDRSLMTNMAGAVQSQMRGTLRFFQLVEGPQDAPTTRFRTLVAAHGSDTWNAAIADLFPMYGGILGDIEVANGTISQLMEAFRERGKVTGSAAGKAIRFFLTVAKVGGISLSPHWQGRKSGPGVEAGSNTRTQRSPRRNRQQPPPSGPPKPPIPGTREVRFPIPGKPEVTVVMPEAISEGEWSLVDNYIRGYIKLFLTS